MSVSPTDNWPPFRLGETFTKDVLFRPDEIRAFATMTGDTNPLHHDEDVARKSRFGRLIASGAQSTAIMASLTAALVADRCASLGLEINFRFKKAVLADDPMRIEWEITQIIPKPKHNGFLLEFSGRLLQLATHAVAVEGTMKTIIFREPPS